MTPKLIVRKWIAEISAALFVLLFLYTGIIKLTGRQTFLVTMQSNPILSPYAALLSWSVPFSEILAVVLLMRKATRRTGLLISALLMTAFASYIGYMLLSQSALPCTCGGIIQQMTWHEHFWFNIIFTILGFTSWHLYPERFVATNRRNRTPVEYSR